MERRLQNKLKNEADIDPENMKIQVPRAVLKPSSESLGGLGAIWWRFLAKLGRRWAQDGRKMGQVGSKLHPRWAMMAPRRPSWAQFGSFWGGPGSMFGYFFRDHWKNG